MKHSFALRNRYPTHTHYNIYHNHKSIQRLAYRRFFFLTTTAPELNQLLCPSYLFAGYSIQDGFVFSVFLSISSPFSCLLFPFNQEDSRGIVLCFSFLVSMFKILVHLASRLSLFPFVCSNWYWKSGILFFVFFSRGGGEGGKKRRGFLSLLKAERSLLWRRRKSLLSLSVSRI